MLAILYILIRKAATDSVIGNINAIDLSRAVFFAPFVIIYNLRLIFLPFHLHNFIVSYPESIISREALYGFVGILIIGLLIYKYKNNKKLLFSSLSFIISLFPVLHIIPTSAVSIVSLRWVYFPIIWLSFCAAFWVGKALETKYRVLCITITGIITLYFGLYTYVLNQNLWRSNETFFKSEVLVFENDFYLDDLAGFYHKKGDYEKAYSYYRKAIRKYPENSQLYVNIGVLLIEMNKPDEALLYLEKIEHRQLKKGDKAKYFNAMGAAYLRKRDNNNSIKFFSLAFQTNPGKLSFCMNLGIAYRQAGLFEESIDVLKQCIVLKADHVKVRKELAYNYMAIEDYQNAIKVLEEITSQKRINDPSIKEMLEKAHKRVMNN
jgi:tetratricopeptide (TPR) repeat protein